MNAASGHNRGAFEGTFVGNAPGRRAVLIQQGERVTGIVAELGAAFEVSMTVSGTSGEGTLGNPMSGQKQQSTIRLVGETLVFENHLGKIELRRGNFRDAAQTSQGGAPDGGVLDPALVGHWSRTDSMFGGGVSVSSQKHMVFQADGTYLEPSSEAVGSGHGWGWQGQQGGVAHAKWTTKDSHIYISAGGPYQPWAGYYVEGNSMLITYSDGSKETWYR